MREWAHVGVNVSSRGLPSVKNLPRVDFVTNARVGVAVVCDQPRVDFVTNARSVWLSSFG